MKRPPRERYETEAATQNWSTREPERQINSLFWERAALSVEKRDIITTTRNDAEKYAPSVFVEDLFVSEFLGLKESPHLTESQLEGALLELLLELGRGFSFVSRQQRITFGRRSFLYRLGLSQ